MVFQGSKSCLISPGEATVQAQEFIKEIYKTHPKPLYLSKLGSLLRQKELFVDNLRELVESMDGFTVAQGPERERTAISTDEDKNAVEDLLNKKAKKLGSKDFQFLSKLPRTLLYAFASKKKGQPNVYIMDSPPYKFDFAKTSESMLEIQSDLLIDATIPFNLRGLNPDDAKRLYENIEQWINDNNFKYTTYVKKYMKESGGEHLTILEEMINAIPANKRSKVVLPLDIIECLISKR